MSDFNLSRFVGIIPGLADEELRYIWDACKEALRHRRDGDPGPRVHYHPTNPTPRGDSGQIWSACGGVVLWFPAMETWGGGHLPDRDSESARTTDHALVTCKRCRRSKVFQDEHPDRNLLPF